jgi:hypothetical protein
MPRASKATASETIALEGLEVKLEHFGGGYSVCSEIHHAGAALVEFSPTDALAQTIPVVMANGRAAGAEARGRR